MSEVLLPVFRECLIRNVVTRFCSYADFNTLFVMRQQLGVTLVQFREFREVLMPGCVLFSPLFLNMVLNHQSQPFF